MKKRVFAAAAIAVFLFLFCFALAGCDLIDRSAFPEGYVEVTDLRVKSANVYLSSNGDTSSYQLDVEVLPAKANQALTYYVPSQYLKYISVSSSGLITAKEITPDGVVIPVKVTSTTNKNATLTVSVTVSDVEVERVYFTPRSITLDFNGDSVKLNPVYEPYHAQDGRTLTYTSGDTNVCTVSADGVVTPGNRGGHAYIYVTSQTLSGKTIEAWVEVTVLYTSGEKQYRLDVSDSAPAYDQVLQKDPNDYKAINFNLIPLNEHLNPNVDIYWFVGEYRVADMNGSWQYKHVPNVGTKTSYRVSVHIKANDEPEIVLYSELITIYNPFVGYSLDFENYSSARASYGYGSTQTFSITAGQASVTGYDWYLKRLGEGGIGEKIARTTAAERDLTARLNVEGDFVLTAKGTDSTGNAINQKEFSFSVTRFVVGDTLILEPNLFSDGLPPESYQYYLTECDEQGHAVSAARVIGVASNASRFSYKLNVAGHYVISSRAVSGGVVARVDGEEFVAKSDVIHVYDKTAADAADPSDLVPEGSRYAATTVAYVQEPVISAIDSDGEKVLVKWTPASGVASYVVEVTASDGEIFLLDSDGKDKSCFGNNYVVIPSSIVTPEQKFSIRVKRKGGAFSEHYYYGYAAVEGREEYYQKAVSTDRYSYLKPFSGVTTGYLTSIKDLGEVMNYVVLNKPTTNDLVTYENVRINGVDYRSYTVKVYPAFALSTVAKDCPAPENEEDIAEGYRDLYRVVLAAQKAYAPTGYYRYAYSALEDGGYSLTIMTPDADATVIRSEEVEKTTTTSPHYSLSPYGTENTAFVLGTRKKVRVSDSEQMYYALASGYGVTPATDAMVNLYNKIANVVNKTVDADMTDGEKALALFDWLCANVVYDTDLAQTSVGTDAFRYAGFRLEGVFHYGQAVCDGISKAYVALCAVEGIPCIRVVGTINGVYHAWNKVFVDGSWYVADATNGSVLTEGGALVINHGLFGLSDVSYAALADEVKEIGDYPVANGSYDYYSGEVNDCALTIASINDLNALVNSFSTRVQTPVSLDVRIDPNFANGVEAIAALLSTVTNETPNEISSDCVFLGGNRVILQII